MDDHRQQIAAAPTGSKAWIRDTRGRPSASLTFAVIAFFVVTLSYVCGMLVSVGSMQFRPFDASAAASYLVPILSLYFGRRFTESRAAVGVEK